MNTQENDGTRRAVQTLTATIALLGFIALGCIAVLYDGGSITLSGQGIGYAIAHPMVPADRAAASTTAPSADRAAIVEEAASTATALIDASRECRLDAGIDTRCIFQ